ncbi:helix-turn-helix domain-containing protein [Amycolatopsis ultiminotia]|uniref:Helix-turn-helix domain-containing protein n=2 Tax=Amycolatopsis ultiminotia TaxID=543629 RepID=A0ABP6YRH4_9PSEU
MSDPLHALAGRQHDLVMLVTQDAPEAQLKTVVEAGRADAAALGQAAEFEQFAEAMFLLHRSRAEDRVRTADLAALVDTVTDLATHRDLDVLLPAICRRARSLLSTDVAYIMLTDPGNGESYVHTTDGVVSEMFRTMRIAHGVGVGGRVASTGQPETTPNYCADARLTHSADIDERVIAEELQGVAAAPLRRGTRVIGVLFACSRATRRFAAREIALLTGLANHAAVAIDNAGLLRDAEQAAADLANAEARARARADHVENIARVRDALAMQALSGAAIPELLDSALSYVPGSLEVDVPQTGFHILRRNGDSDDLPHRFEVDISAGPERLGVLRLRRAQVDGSEEDVLGYAAGLVANALLRHQAASEADLREQAHVLEAVIDGRDEDGDLRRLFSRMGASPDDPAVVLVWTPSPKRARRAWWEAAKAAATDGGVAATVRGNLTVVVPGKDAGLAARDWRTRFRRAHPDEDVLTIGAASSTHGADGLRDAARRAERVLCLLRALGRTGVAADAEGLGLLGQLLGGDARPDLSSVLRRTLEPLAEHDTADRIPLTPVVEAFIANDGHLAHTARQLHVHVNTLYRRLEAVDTVLGGGWRSGDQRLELALALRLRKIDRQLLDSSTPATK